MSDLWMIDMVVRHTRAARLVATQMFEEQIQTARGASLLESPLEAIFWTWWHVIQLTSTSENTVVLEPQHQVVIEGRRYRLDFSVRLASPLLRAAIQHDICSWTKVAIEVDGHAFHERTPEDQKNRDQRDRDLLSAGWRPFHFSTAELEQRHVGCAVEVWDFCINQAEGVRAAYVAWSQRASDEEREAFVRAFLTETA